MPFRKRKIKAACDEFLRSVLHRDEQVVAVTLALRGLGYYWRGAGGKSVFVVVTDERILFVDASTMLGIRPRELYLRDPRRDDAVIEMRREFDPSPLHLWTTRVRYLTTHGHVLQLHFSSYWEEDNRAVLQAMTAGVGREPPDAHGDTASRGEDS